MNGAMTTDPDQLRAQVTELLADLPDPSASDNLASDNLASVDLVAARLEQSLVLLAIALESVDKG